MLVPAAILGVLAASPDGRAAAPTIEDLRSLSLEELSVLEVSSVFKRAEPLGRTPASVYVITSEEIRRSGALTLAEALRLAPNLEVARMNARDYAVSARGFNAFQLSNKMLVLIDGRSVYTPLHAGVLWDEEQVMLEDVERIEVISGPSGTTWGANAVNGVVNVIMRSAHDTRGGVAAAEHGTVDSRVATRYGGEIGDTGAWRAYALGFNMGETQSAQDTGRNDDWQARQTGFRTDFKAGASEFTVEGALFENTYQGDGSNSGGNLTGRWNYTIGPRSVFSLQAYFSHTERNLPTLDEELETIDIEARHKVALGESHELIWGGGLRQNRESFDNDRTTPVAFFLEPVEGTVRIGNLFVQDSFALTSDLTATVGVKYETNTYTGGKFLPSARLAWQVADDHMLWGAVSRAIRTPSRIDREFQGTAFGAPFFDEAGDGFGDETLIAYELGYRGKPDSRSNFSLTVYYQDYDDLRVIVPSPAGRLTFGNAQDGYTMGIESWGDYRVTDRWRLMAGLNLMRKSLELDPTASTVALHQHQGNDPEYQIFLRSYYNITDDIELDATIRKVDSLPAPEISGYTALDLRIAWHVTERLELSLTGTGLLDPQHPESGQPGERGEIPRSVYAGARWRF